MEQINNINVNPTTVANILTLRYSPTINPLLRKASWTDFKKKKISLSLDFLEQLIDNQIKKKILDSKTKNLSIALSGGVDSTLVLAMIRKLFPKIDIEAISVKFAESVDESKNAKKIAEHFDVHQNILHIDNYLKELPKAISIIKLPFWDLHWYYVVKKAKTLSNNLVSGDGGDELFGGYTFRYKKFLSLVTSNSKPLEKIKAYLECHERDRVPDQEKIFGNKTNFSWDSIHEILMPYFDNSLPLLEQVFLADYNGKLLFNFSPINTRLHDYFGVNSITPLLADELISYCFQLKFQEKYDSNSNIGKLPLRKILSKYDVDLLVSTEKLGFNVNTINLWKSFGHYLCSKYLLDSHIVNDGWINKLWIEKYIDKDELDVKYVNKFLGLLAFEIWYRLFITKDMNENTVLI